VGNGGENDKLPYALSDRAAWDNEIRARQATKAAILNSMSANA